MNFGEQLGTSIGGYLGSRTQAEGFDKGLTTAKELEKHARSTRDMIDPSGDRRKGYGDEYFKLMTGRKDYQETADFDFRRRMGLQGLNRSHAAAGLSQSGSAMASAMKFNMGEAYQGLQSHLDRLTNVGSLGQQAGIAGGQAFGNMMTERARLMTDMYVGRAQAQGTSQAILGHGIGQQGDNIAKSIMSSDVRLKKNIRRVGKDGDLNRYKWQWNSKAQEVFGLEGEQEGYLAQEVVKTMPEAVTTVKGYMAIDYAYLYDLEEVA